MGVGTATIRATAADGSGVYAQCSITVNGKKVTKVTLNKSNLNMLKGETSVLIATVEPTDAENKNLIWTSGNSNVATVSNGTVAAVGTGTTTIYVSSADGGARATCTVTVSWESVTGIKLNKTSLFLERGTSETLTATVLPENATNKEITWESSDESVVTVENGIVSAVKKEMR